MSKKEDMRQAMNVVRKEQGWKPKSKGRAIEAMRRILDKEAGKYDIKKLIGGIGEV